MIYIFYLKIWFSIFNDLSFFTYKFKMCKNIQENIWREKRKYKKYYIYYKKNILLKNI